MATLSLRIREDLKRKAQELAQRQGVSLNNYINAALAAAVAQAETLAFFEDRLKDVDLNALQERVLSFMRETEPGGDPSVDELRDAMGDRF
jgi:antitoxin component of RelBE/YafQ-DinJ toxin-antitoxin module